MRSRRVSKINDLLTQPINDAVTGQIVPKVSQRKIIVIIIK